MSTLLAALPLVALSVVGGEESPTGRKQVALVPDARMTALGEENFRELLRTRPLDQDPARRAYLVCVTRALVAALPAPRGRWTVSGAI